MAAVPNEELYGRLVAIETRQADDRSELMRVRNKVHELVASLSTISLLTNELARVHEDITGMRSEIPNIARRSAEEAIGLALERQDELGRLTRGEGRARLGVVFQVSSVLIGVAGVVFGLLALLHQL